MNGHGVEAVGGVHDKGHSDGDGEVVVFHGDEVVGGRSCCGDEVVGGLHVEAKKKILFWIVNTSLALLSLAMMVM